MKKLLICVWLLLIPAYGAIPSPVEAATTVGETISEVLASSVAFDSVRFPVSVLLPFINDAQMTIATVGRTKQAQATIALTANAITYVLPADFYLLEAVILNRDPSKVPGAGNFPFAIRVVPRRELGKGVVVSTDRPTEVSQWVDSLVFDKTSPQEKDTVTVDYFAYPTRLDTITDTIDLPDAYLPLLKDYVLAKCYDRIQLQGPPRTDTEARIKLLEQTLLGRPADEK